MNSIISPDTIESSLVLIYPFLFQLIMGTCILVGGWFASMVITKVVKHRLLYKLDKTIALFSANVISVGLKLLVISIALSAYGLETTSFAALLGAAGVAIGVALSGNMQNITSAMVILFFKTIEVGDVISVKDTTCTIKEIGLFHSKAQRFDQSFVYIPNSELSNSILINYSQHDVRRITAQFSISYNDSIVTAKEIILQETKKIHFVLPEKDIKIGVSELGESGITITVHYWISNNDVLLNMMGYYEPVYTALTNAGITIPYPTRTIYTEKQ